MSGGRLKFLALFVLFEFIASAPIALSGFLSILLAQSNPSHWREIIQAGVPIGGAVARMTFPVWSAVLAMSYRELCRTHDGLAPSEIGDIFA